VGVAAPELVGLHPVVEGRFGFPAGEDEPSGFSGDGSQELEALESGHLVDFAGAGGETSLEVGAVAVGDRDGVDSGAGGGNTSSSVGDSVGGTVMSS
jgi:hypothetical protein